MSKTTKSLLAIASIFVLGLLVYGGGLHGGFIFDDYPNLLDAEHWRLESLEWGSLQRVALSGIASDAGRPLAMLSFGFNYYYTGMEPFAFKVTGLSIHLLNGSLTFLLCRRLFALAPAPVMEARLGNYAAWLVALAWTLHPLQVSSALYVVQRMELGAHTFVLLALLAYLRGRTVEDDAIGRSLVGARVPPGVRAFAWFALAGLCILLGLGFKETALLAIGYALLIELCLLRFRRADSGISRSLVVCYVLGVTLALTVYAFKFVPAAMKPWAFAFRDFDLGERLLTQMPVLAMYLRQMVLPLPEALRFYYDNFPISTGLLSPPSTLRSLLLLLGLVVAGLASVRRYPLITLGVGWFFVAHALTSNIWPLELAFEHRNYAALLGILIVLAQMLAWATRGLNLNTRRLLAALPVVLLAVLCTIHARTWGDPTLLAMSLSSRNPGSARAGYDMGRHFLVRSNYDASSPLFGLARREFEHASGLPNASSLPDQALIIMDARIGQPTPDVRWHALRDKLIRHTIGAQDLGVLSALSDCSAQEGCKIDKGQLLGTFLTVLPRNPGSADLHTIYAFFAINSLGDVVLAVEMGREAVRLAPDNPQYKVNLAKFLVVAGEGDSEESQALLRDVRAANRGGRFNEELHELEKLRHITESVGHAVPMAK